MPTYEYECVACRRQFELEQRISDPVLTECPECHGQVRRLVSAGNGFIIKGSGSASSHHQPRSASECSLARTGKTCCGRDEKCGDPPCGSER